MTDLLLAIAIVLAVVLIARREIAPLCERCRKRHTEATLTAEQEREEQKFLRELRNLMSYDGTSQYDEE